MPLADLVYRAEGTFAGGCEAMSNLPFSSLTAAVPPKNSKFRQIRNIPAPAESLDQQHSRIHAPPLDISLIPFRCVPRSDDFKDKYPRRPFIGC